MRSMMTLRIEGKAMRSSKRHFNLSAIFCCAGFLTACTTVAPYGSLPAECSGVPGDLRTPNGDGVLAQPAVAPAGPSGPTELIATARPFNSTGIPLLYIYDEDSDHVTSGMPIAKVLIDPVFAKVEAEAYWNEVAEGRFYRIPWLDKCSQASMLREPISFHAPPHGLLFVQFVVSSCNECERISSAIRAVIATHPELPVRWVRIRIPANVGSLKRE
jgi:hypothetical protein